MHGSSTFLGEVSRASKPGEKACFGSDFGNEWEEEFLLECDVVEPGGLNELNKLLLVEQLSILSVIDIRRAQ